MAQSNRDAEAQRNSMKAAAIFASHRVQLGLDSQAKIDRMQALDDSDGLLITPDPEQLASEFEAHMQAQLSTSSPAEAFNLRSRAREGSIDVSREHSTSSIISHKASHIELQDMIEQLDSDSWVRRAWHFIETMSRRAFFLILLGVLSGVVAVLINWCIKLLIEAGINIVKGSRNGTVGFFAYVGYVLLLAGISLVVTRFGSPLAAGSGIPEMKSILSGARMPQYLGFRTLATKIVGLIFSVGSNLTVGQEGPFVHIASAISHILLRLRWFAVLASSDHFRQQMLSIGCGVGIAASFGSPFGGMLYAIETTSTYYSMDNYFASFLACVFGAFVFRYLANLIAGQQYWVSILQTEYQRVGVDISFWDLLFFALLGLLLAAAGVLLIFLFSHAAEWRNTLRVHFYASTAQTMRLGSSSGASSSADSLTSSSSSSSSTANNEASFAAFPAYQSPAGSPEAASSPSSAASPALSLSSSIESPSAMSSSSMLPLPPLSWYQSIFLSPYVYSFAIVLLTAILNFPGLIGDFLSLGTHDVLESLFSNKPDLAQALPAKDWTSGAGAYFNLLVFGILRLLLCAVSITMPLPAGLFMPCMAVGAGLGRFWGNAMTSLFAVKMAPGVFAVAGAAGMVAATTHSISTILILLEVTGQMYFAYPVTICVLVALTVSRRFSKSIYESIILSRRLPYLPTLKDKDLDSSIFSIIDPCPASVPKVCPVSAMIRVLSKHDQSVLPVVLGANNPLFVGSIQRQQLEKCVIEALRCAMRELDSSLIRIPPSSSSSSSSSHSNSGVELVDSADSDDASSRQQQQQQSREEQMMVQRDLLARLCKMALDPMHTCVLVRKDIDLEPLLRQLADFERPIELQFDATPVRFLPDTSIVHAHVLFILFRLEYAFVTDRGLLSGQVSRMSFVRAIQDS